MNAELKKDLQSSHFNIGREDYKNDWSTTTSERNYPPGYVTKRTDNSELKKDLRAVHFILGDDKPVFKSTAHRTFTKFSEDVDRSDFKSAKTLLEELRKSNVKLRMSEGKDEWTSDAAANFRAKPIDAETLQKERVNARLAKKALQKTSVKLGSETKTDYGTTNMMQRPRDDVNYKSELIAKDLRSTNWKTGNDRVLYESEYKSSNSNAKQVVPLIQRDKIGYVVRAPHEKVESKVASNDPYRNCSIRLGEGSSSMRDARSLASESYVRHDNSSRDVQAERRKIEQQKRELRQTSVRLGLHKNKYVPESRKIGKNLENAARSKAFDELKAELRATHLCLGSDKANYQSEAKAKLFNANREAELKSQPQELSRASELLEELRKSNIVLGRDKEKMSSEMSSNYHKPSSESYGVVGFSDTLGKELRRSHIVLGRANTNTWSTDSNDLFSKNIEDKYKQSVGVSADDRKSVERMLRRTNYELGTDKLNYVTEGSEMFSKKKPEPAVSFKHLKAELQKRNYVLGYDKRDYGRTSIGHL